MPFKDLDFKFYPGHLINSFGIDYREKIQEKGDKMEKPGSCQIWKTVGMENFEALLFVKVEDDNTSA